MARPVWQIHATAVPARRGDAPIGLEYNPHMGWLGGLIIAGMVALGGAYLGGGGLMAGYVMPGDAMYPKIERGTRVRVRYSAPSSLSRGQIVMFQMPGEEGYIIRRVIGLPGETLEIVASELRINGAKVAEPWLAPPVGSEPRVENPAPEYVSAVVIPDGHVFVMGDYRKGSKDSRLFGTVQIANVVGVVWDLFGMVL